MFGASSDFSIPSIRTKERREALWSRCNSPIPGYLASPTCCRAHPWTTARSSLSNGTKLISGSSISYDMVFLISGGGFQLQHSYLYPDYLLLLIHRPRLLLRTRGPYHIV